MSKKRPKVKKRRPKEQKTLSPSITPEEMRLLGTMGRSALLPAKLAQDLLTHQLLAACGIRPNQRPGGARLLDRLDAIPIGTPPGKALWFLGAVINSTREMIDFTPSEVHRLTEHVHRLATTAALRELAWDQGVVLRKYLAYGMLVYEPERTAADWEMAERCARDAVMLLAKHAPDDAMLPEIHYGLGLTLLNRRNVNGRRQRMREAEGCFIKALNGARGHEDLRIQRRALLNLGILNDEGSFEEPSRILRAVEYFDELVGLDQTSVSDPHVYLQALLNRGWALLRFPPDLQPTAVRRAIADLKEAVRLSREAKHNDQLAHLLYFLGLALDTLSFHEPETRHDEQALAAYNESLGLYRRLGNGDGESRVLHNMGLLHQHRGQFDQALAYYEKALPLREGRAIEEWETLGNIVDIRVRAEMPHFGEVEGDEQLLSRIDELAQQHQDHGNLELSLRSHRYALHLVARAQTDARTDRSLRERARRAIVAAELAWSGARDARERYHQARWLGTFYAAWGWLEARSGEPAAAILDGATRGKARSFLTERRAQATDPSLPVNSTVMRERLQKAPRTALIDISTSALGTVVLVAHLDQKGELALTTHALAPNEIEVAGWLQNPAHGWLIKLEKLRVSSPQTQIDALENCVTGMRTLLEHLYHAIIGPSVRGLREQGIQDLVFSVQGPLAALPLAAASYLVDSEPRYLIEDFRSVVLVPSLVNFLYPDEPRDIRRALHVLGNERSLPREAKKDAQDLEAEWVKSGLDVESLTNPTPEQFLAHLGRFDLLHAVCHGVFDPWRLDQSGIQVAGDELLSCERILAQPILAGSSLLVLCACRSGRSRAEDFGGEWLGPAGVFLRAGVQSVLAGLWDVDYTATEGLSRVFYRNLFQSHQPAAIALAGAMRDALNQGREAVQGIVEPHRLQAISDTNTKARIRRLLSAPWFWAGMQLISTMPFGVARVVDTWDVAFCPPCRPCEDPPLTPCVMPPRPRANPAV